MRLHRGVSTLAAVASLALAGAPAASASDIGAGGGGLPPAPQAQAHHESSSTDWGLIALGTGGAVLLVGAGVGGSRMHSRRRTSRRGVQARVS